MSRSPGPRVLVLGSLDEQTLENLEAKCDLVHQPVPATDVLPRLVRDRDVIIFRSGVHIGEELLEEARELRLLLRAGSGLDNVDLEAVKRRGIQLQHFPDPGAEAVAELTIGLIIALARHIPLADRLMRRHQWAKSDLIGSLIRGKRLGIVGAGRIGRLVAERAGALGMTVIGCIEPSLMESSLGNPQNDDLPFEYATFEETVRGSDFVSIHVPLTDSTYHLVDRHVLDQMKEGSFLINVARGGVVDEEDLRLVLERGSPLKGAALDVHESESSSRVSSPFLTMDNVILTPHIGSMAKEVQSRIGKRVVEALDDFARDARSSATNKQ